MVEMYYFAETELVIEFDMSAITRQEKKQILADAEKSNGKAKRVR